MALMNESNDLWEKTVCRRKEFWGTKHDRVDKDVKSAGGGCLIYVSQSRGSLSTVETKIHCANPLSRKCNLLHVSSSRLSLSFALPDVIG